MKVTIAMCALLGWAPGVGLSGGFFRCGDWLVSADMPVAELLKKCGAPSTKTSTTEDVRIFNGEKVGTSTTEIWRYDRGSTAAPMIVTVVDGQIRSIR